MYWVSGGVNRDIRCEHNIIADYDFTHIENNAVEVGVKIFANFDIVAVVTVKRRFNCGKRERSFSRSVASISRDRGGILSVIFYSP